MTSEISLSSLVQLQLQLPGALDLVGAGAAEAGGPGPEGAAADAAELSTPQVASDEQAARLRSQAPLATNTLATSMTSRVETTAAVLRSEGVLPAAENLRIEPSGLGGNAAVGDLNLTPAVVTALHVGAAQMQPPTGAVPDDEVRRRRQRQGSQDDGRRDSDEPGQGDESGTDRSEQDNDALHPGVGHVAGDDERTVEGIVERPAVVSDEALFSHITDALSRGRRSDMLRQLRASRRIVVVFPDEEPRGLNCAARAYLLWRDAIGVGRMAGLAARLNWVGIPNGKDWSTLRAYKDRTANGGWCLRVQPSAPGKRGVAIRLGAAPVLPGAWTEVCLHIPDAARFWRALGNQFSLQAVISTIPLKRWSDS